MKVLAASLAFAMSGRGLMQSYHVCVEDTDINSIFLSGFLSTNTCTGIDVCCTRNTVYSEIHLLTLNPNACLRLSLYNADLYHNPSPSTNPKS